MSKGPEWSPKAKSPVVSWIIINSWHCLDCYAKKSEIPCTKTARGGKDEMCGDTSEKTPTTSRSISQSFLSRQQPIQIRDNLWILFMIVAVFLPQCLSSNSPSTPEVNGFSALSLNLWTFAKHKFDFNLPPHRYKELQIKQGKWWRRWMGNICMRLLRFSFLLKVDDFKAGAVAVKVRFLLLHC